MVFKFLCLQYIDFKKISMNIIIKVSFNNYYKWKASFDNHAERYGVCYESRIIVGKLMIKIVSKCCMMVI